MQFYLFALVVFASTLAYSLAKADPYPDEGDHSFGTSPAELIRNKRACVFMNGKMHCGDSGTAVFIPGDVDGDIYAPCRGTHCRGKRYVNINKDNRQANDNVDSEIRFRRYVNIKEDNRQANGNQGSKIYFRK